MARSLAQRLMAYDAVLHESANAEKIYTCSVCEKLRIFLSTVLGLDSYRFLLAQALNSAKDEAPTLAKVSVLKDGSIEGLTGEAATASGVLIAHLLSSIETVVGETVTRWILSDVWPGLSGLGMQSRGNETT
ncbi:MAG: hypothetical protein ACRYFU_09330 [Janthinobacterium lividum]